jgi:hypothetical protein
VGTAPRVPYPAPVRYRLVAIADGGETAGATTLYVAALRFALASRPSTVGDERYRRCKRS